MDDPRGASVEDGGRVFFRDVKPYPIVDHLGGRLSTYRLLHRVGVPSTPTPFARHLATRVERVGARLRRDLERVTSVEARDTMHRVRIRLKRQRAMLAPLNATTGWASAAFDPHGLATSGIRRIASAPKQRSFTA